MDELSLTRLDSGAADFEGRLAALLARGEAADARVQAQVAEIIRRVRAEGDAALREYTRLYDQFETASPKDLELPRGELQAAWDRLPAATAEALEVAAERIRAYAERQRLESWSYVDAQGTRLGQQVTPLDRVGLYVPGVRRPTPRPC